MFTIQFAEKTNGNATSAPKTTAARTSPAGWILFTALLAP